MEDGAQEFHELKANTTRVQRLKHVIVIYASPKREMNEALEYERKELKYC